MDHLNTAAHDGVKLAQPVDTVKADADAALRESWWASSQSLSTSQQSTKPVETDLTFDNPYPKTSKIGNGIGNFAVPAEMMFLPPPGGLGVAIGSQIAQEAQGDLPDKQLKQLKEFDPKELAAMKAKLEALNNPDGVKDLSETKIADKKLDPILDKKLPADNGKVPLKGLEGKPTTTEVDGMVIIKYPDGSVKKVPQSEFERNPEKEREQRLAWAQKMLDHAQLTDAERTKLENFVAQETRDRNIKDQPKIPKETKSEQSEN